MVKRKKRTFEKIIYAVIIAFAVVSFWRGVWHLLDIYLFPGDVLLSSWASLAIGLLILYLTKNLIRELI